MKLQSNPNYARIEALQNEIAALEKEEQKEEKNHEELKDENIDILRFVFYYLQTVDVSSIVRGTPPKINQQNLRSIKIPVPPLEEQERIVNILDKFDALCNDITKGLPAEIEMRKKQYEYYRDKLLTFKEKNK